MWYLCIYIKTIIIAVFFIKIAKQGNHLHSYSMSHQVSNYMVVWTLSAIDPEYPEHNEHHGSGVHQGTYCWLPTPTSTTRVKARRLRSLHLLRGWERWEKHIISKLLSAAIESKITAKIDLI